jgi:hypothetical protein
MAPSGRGADFTATLPFALHLRGPGARRNMLATSGDTTTFREGEIQSAKRVRAAMSPEAAGTQRADRDGVSVTQPHADTEGPRPGTRCWVEAEGVSEHSERGRASDERPLTRLARKGAVTQLEDKTGPRTPGAKRPVPQGTNKLAQRYVRMRTR